MRFHHSISLFILLLLVGCGGGGGGDATAPNDFTIPDAIVLTADYPTLAAGTATPVTVVAKFTGASDQDLTLSSSITLSAPTGAVASPAAGLPVVVADAGVSGTSVITATWTGPNGDKVEGHLTLNVVNSSVTAITLSPDVASIPEGATQQFVAEGTFSLGDPQNLFWNVIWESSSTDATVNSTGLATAVDAGSATIFASFGGETGSAALTVEAVLVGIELSSDPAHISQGESAQFTVAGVYSDGSVSGNFTEQSSFTLEPGPITAIISNTAGSRGLLTGVSADGDLLVTATYGSFSDTYSLAIFTPTP